PVLDPNPAVANLPRSAAGLPADAFVFLFVFDAASAVERKNPAGLVRAFRAAFPAEPDVRLVIKTSRLDAAPDRDVLLRAAAGDSRVVLLGGVLPRPAVLGL